MNRILFFAIFIVISFSDCKNASNHYSGQKSNFPKFESDHEECDGPSLAMQQLFDQTKDPKTGLVPRETLWPIIEYTDQLKQDIRNSLSFSNAKTTSAGWQERGPISDVVGVSNGNTRAGNGVASGRCRGLLIDASDATGNTVFVGSVGGGLWKTTNISTAPCTWIPINDKLSNLCITGICQNPNSLSTMYMCTGEANYNADAVRGDGIFKSLDGGNTWSQLSSTTAATSGNAFNYCSRIICDAAGNVYVGTRTGLKRSVNGGSSWTDITPTGVNSNEISDIKISSTGRMHIMTGYVFSTILSYRFTDNPSTATTSTGWQSATTLFTSAGKNHAIVAVKGDTLFALPANSSGYNVTTIYNSTDGGVHWAALANTPASFTSQGWYCLAAAINPSNGTQYIAGSLDCYRTLNAGNSAWTKVSNWVGTTGSYVHADQHEIVWYNASGQSRILVISDGGIFLSTDGGATFTDRNTGLRIKQFYSCAISPKNGSDYLLGGAQDNGCHSLSNSGLSTSIEVTGGDGAFVHIDQTQPAYQYGSYTRNVYRRSTDSGVHWTSITLNNGTGLFINPTDYDDTSNVMYCSEGTSGFRRWSNPQTGSTSSVIAVTALSSGSVNAIAVSPFTFNRIYLGTSTGVLAVVNGANTATTPVAGTSIGTGFGTINSIVFGASEDTILVTNSSYSGTQIWYTTNGTNSTPTWVSKDGNLPNMPVWSSLFIPGTGGKRVMIATETGVWETKDISAASPIWVPDPIFPNVRTTMLQIRKTDLTVVASTYGRGLWSANAAFAAGIALPINDFVLMGNANNSSVSLNWNFKTSRTQIQFEIERSENGQDFVSVGSQFGGSSASTYNFQQARTIFGWCFYRIKCTDQYGLVQYSNKVSIAPSLLNSIQLSSIYPNPANNQLNLTLKSPTSGQIILQLFTMDGKLLMHAIQQYNMGTQTISTGISSVPPGNYLLLATLPGKSQSFRFSKK